jgi:hypothetical protein
MIELKCFNPVFYDVDDTLLMRTGRVEGAFELVGPRGSIWYKPHLPHCKIIKELFAQGITVIVWSQGGSEHAARAVKALGLEQFVDLCMEKPHWVVDDKPVEAWMPKAAYKDPILTEETNGGASSEVQK